MNTWKENEKKKMRKKSLLVDVVSLSKWLFNMFWNEFYGSFGGFFDGIERVNNNKTVNTEAEARIL